MISEKLKLDDIDRKIITLLQERPNLTHTEIADQIDRSQPTVGMRIKKLEKSGILQFQPGINFKKVQLYLATVELNTKRPDEALEMAQCCPFMLNAFKLSGEHNICILLASSSLQKLENVVNFHFRNKPEVSRVSMEVVTEIAKDFILPIDFDSEEHEPSLEKGCGEKCKWLLAKKRGEI
ncbi:MAG: winged helix-turn-helix transcriptional regulator [Candidatus Lokiarchaeota archaeon]|nr:winged helix-turn-helix transcriptional regulator [Candidatus Lokiarchaeota archaeon]MBD3340761.1 winged helix-turn-helix transcriptional regulator [Candidatus Lokiarchaeota archaeon]